MCNIICTKETHLELWFCISCQYILIFLQKQLLHFVAGNIETIAAGNSRVYQKKNVRWYGHNHGSTTLPNITFFFFLETTCQMTEMKFKVSTVLTGEVTCSVYIT